MGYFKRFFVVIGFGILGVICGSFAAVFLGMILDIALMPYTGQLGNMIEITKICMPICQFIGICIGIYYGFTNIK